MSATSFELSKRLNQGPAVLFLGQNYLYRADTGNDPFLDQILKKYSDNVQAKTYDQILQLRLPSPEIFLSWARERIDQYVSTPPWLPIVAKFAWNNVYTSAIDTLWYKNFRTEWRELFPIYLEKIKPAEIRSSGILNCTFLFGCIDQPANDPNFRPPLSVLEKNKRKQEAVALLRRLPEIVTPFGTLVFEGYDGFTDWIGWDDILPIVDSLQPGQAHFFSISEDVLQHSDVQELVKQQKIIIHSENLASYFVEKSSEIKMGLLKEDVEGKKRIAIGEKVLYVPHELYNSISRTALVVDDSIFEPLPALQPDGVYVEFRRFLANSSKRPVWSGYYWGFNFKRDFETQLLSIVNREINSVSLQKNPVIIHGPSGTGKTVALGSLAFEIRKNNKCAVLFIERKPARPSYADLDEFAAWAEHNGSPVTLIIWDGMVDEDEYSKLLNYLTGRGRKVVIVGSCYEVVSIPNQAKNYIHASSDFNKEISRFVDHIIKIAPAFKQVIGKIQNNIDPYFLVMLYRMLPETASQLQDGIINEVNFAQNKLVVKTTKENMPENSLAYYFLKVGLISEEDLSLTKYVIVDSEEITEVEKLIGLIMVPGRFGLNVPVELIVRALNRTWLQTFTDLLGEISIFNMDFDEHTGVISVGPRHTLEAKFIVERRMGGSAATEVDYASKLLLELSPSAEIDSYEFQFAVDLIRKMGPNGEDKTYFAPHFKTLSSVLEELRTQRGVINPRLMLQEAVLLREWLKNITIKDVKPISDEERLQTYHKAAQILEKAYKDSSPILRSTILAELAANLGAENKVNISRGAVKDALATYEKAKSSIVGALKYTPADYHPLDVIAWMSEDLIESNLTIDDRLRAELAADWFHLFSMADENEYSDQQRVLYNSKMAALGRIIDNRDLLRKSLQMLEEIGSKAGYYLQAFWIIRDYRKRTRKKSNYLLLPTNESASDDDIPSYLAALKFLEDNEKEIGIDGRCLSLKFKLWWLVKTKKPLFLHERERLAFSLDDWRYLLNLTNKLLETSDLFYSTPIKYTKAVALFHLGNYTEMLELFREVDRESAQNGKGPKRIFRHYLASNEKGDPIQYSGRILWVDLEQDRGQVYVPALSRPITFIPRDFPRWNEMRKDQPLPVFHIAFNFIGPVADPVSRFHKNR